MPRYFFDSSSIVKRYHREAGTDWVRAVCEPRSQPVIILSQVARIEVVAALRRTGRIEGMHPSSVDALVNHFKRHVTRGAYELVPIGLPVVTLAIAFCDRYWDLTPGPLRSLDAIHLASALLIRHEAPSDLTFVTSDVRLAAIAAFEGLRVINPAYPPRP